MKGSTLLLAFTIAVLIISSIDARKTSSRRGSGGSSSGSRYSTRTTSRPQQSQAKKGQEYRNWAAKLTGAGQDNNRKNGNHHKGGSNPGSIGWNVPAKQSPSSNVKPSAPVSDSVSKTSATNVQSSNWQPSGGYGSQTNKQPYNPPVNTGNQGYNPSVGGYNQHTPHGSQMNNPSHNQPYGAPPPYSPHGAPPPYSPHGAPPAYGSHPSYGAPPAYGAPPVYGSNGGYSGGYHAPPAYNPSYGHSSSPGAGYNPPVGHAPQTIVVGQSSRPGIGQLAKEAFVFAGVSAGVNAAVNRILPGGIYGNSHHGGSSGNAAVPAGNTQITYNNYYNNGSAPADGQAPAAAAPPVAPVAAGSPAAPAAVPPPVVPIQEQPTQNTANNNASPDMKPAETSAPANQNPTNPVPEEQNFPSPSGQIITKADLQALTEDLLNKDNNNAQKYITMKLQGQKMDDSTNDDAPEPLLVVKDEAYEIPTVKAVLALHDNYELDIKIKENVTPEKRREENDLLDLIMETEVMKATMKFLADKGFVPNDEYEFKDSLKRMWFSQFKRIDSEPGSSGFETVFLAEQFDKEIIGMHNWIYYAKQEAAKKLNYLGYIKHQTLGDKGEIVKLRSSLNEIIQPVTTIFIGTSPELEMALYTMCFFARPNYPCPIKLSGAEFIIIANRVNYFGKDILVSAYPEI